MSRSVREDGIPAADGAEAARSGDADEGGGSRVRALLERVVGIDPRSLAAVRIGTGLLLLADLFLRARYLRAHYTDDGVLPRADLLQDFLVWPGFLSIHLAGGSALIQGALFLLAAAAALALLVGWRTRLATAVSWLLLISLHARNPVVLQSGDTVLRLLLFWSLFLPLGRTWSVDALQAGRWRAPGETEGGEAGAGSSDDASDGDGSAGPVPAPRPVLSVASAALLAQVVFIYTFAVAWKDHPIWFVDATAVWYALSIDQFTTAFGAWLLRFPALLAFFTRATLVVEAAGPLLALAPWSVPRVLGVVTMMGLHLGFALTMKIGLFPWICIVAWLAFLPPAFWDRLAAFARRRGLAADRAARGLARLAERLPGPRRPPRPTPRWWRVLVQGLAAGLLAFVFFWNLADLRGLEMPHAGSNLARTLRLDQKWSMFAPYPLRQDGWYVPVGHLEDDGGEDDGGEIALPAGGTPDFTKPHRVSKNYPTQRWRKYLMNLRRDENAGHRPLYAAWLCNQWNRSHPDGPWVDELSLWFVEEFSMPPEEPLSEQRVLLGRYVCPP